MNPPPSYSAERAANVVVALSLMAAVVCGWAGVLQLREGENVGYFLILLGVLPLLGSLLIRASVRRSSRSR